MDAILRSIVTISYPFCKSNNAVVVDASGECGRGVLRSRVAGLICEYPCLIFSGNTIDL
jgi:hypothetical protein